MGMVLSLPMLLAGIWAMATASRLRSHSRYDPAENPHRRADRCGGADSRQPLHGALPVRSADGYYTTREPFGAAGDFVTAPEISQMFGELIAVWLYEAWLATGRPMRPPSPRSAPAAAR